MIFCVEDDTSIRDLMQYTLSAAGFETRGLSCAEELYDALHGALPELILLDIMLPGEDGLSVLKKLRALSRTADIPVILASAKGTEYDKVIGLDSGADDYLAKPFGMMELISRVRAVLRRSAPKSAAEILLSVSDTGIGIPEKEKERIFERFYRVDKSHSKSIGGTGLGLSIVKHAAKLHNARIELNSVIDGGTTVTVIFPAGGSEENE